MRRQTKPTRWLFATLPLGVVILSANYAASQICLRADQAQPSFCAVTLPNLLIVSPDKILRRISTSSPSLFEANPVLSRLPLRSFGVPAYQPDPFVINDRITSVFRRPSGWDQTQVKWCNLSASNNKPPLFSPAKSVAGDLTIQPDWDINDYGRHIPLAGPIILQVAKQAQNHPRITRILKTVRPTF